MIRKKTNVDKANQGKRVKKNSNQCFNKEKSLVCYLKKAKMDDTETKENIFMEVQSSQKQINSIQCHIRPIYHFRRKYFKKLMDVTLKFTGISFMFPLQSKTSFLLCIDYQFMKF